MKEQISPREFQLQVSIKHKHMHGKQKYAPMQIVQIDIAIS